MQQLARNSLDPRLGFIPTEPSLLIIVLNLISQYLISQGSVASAIHFRPSTSYNTWFGGVDATQVHATPASFRLLKLGFDTFLKLRL